MSSNCLKWGQYPADPWSLLSLLQEAVEKRASTITTFTREDDKEAVAVPHMLRKSRLMPLRLKTHAKENYE